MAPLHEMYSLRVTAGSTYDRTQHTTVPVNTEKPLHIESDLIDAQVRMRIKDYRGTFQTIPHIHSRKQYLTNSCRPPQKLPHHIPLLLHPAAPIRPLLHIFLVCA